MNGPFRLPYPWWNSLMFAPFILSWSILVRTSERFSLKTIFLFHTCNQNPIISWIQYIIQVVFQINRSNYAHSNDMDWYFKYSNDWSIVGYIDQSSDENFTWLVVDCMLLSIVKWSNSKKNLNPFAFYHFMAPIQLIRWNESWIVICFYIVSHTCCIIIILFLLTIIYEHH